MTLRNKYRCSKGFTLAEILITIGIIGVVAAITIPLLIQNSNSKKFVTQFKKSLSTLNQAAISAQAQYDMDYSLLTMVNDDTTCKTDTLADGNYSICGLFNNTLAAQTYLGRYGNVKAANGTGVYSANVSSFSVNDFLFFSFADGAFVAFNPTAQGCGVGVGNAISTNMITSGQLANCLGFIDVNGPTPPNKEVKCAEEDTVLSVNTTCKVTNGSMGDIFPVVFHDGAVEPVTNAALAAFLGGNGKEAAAQAPQKTAAQLAAEKVDDSFQKSVLNNLDAAKAAALEMYKNQQDEIAAIVANDGNADNHGMPNIAIYQVYPKLDGTFEIELYRVNVDVGSKDGTFSSPGGKPWDDYRIIVQGDKVYSNIRLREVDGKTEAYKSGYGIYLNKFHTTTPESNNFDF